MREISELRIHEEEIIIGIIMDYAFDMYIPTYDFEVGIHSDYFEECSHTNFICKELVDRVLEYEGDSVMDVIRNFAHETWTYANKNKPPLLFKLAHNIAMDILETCNSAGIGE